MTRKTKIIATLGPASGDAAAIERLARAGADVFRLNFSHGSHADHAARAQAVRAAEARLGRPLGILLDLQGPKLRIGTLAQGRVQLATGAVFQLDSDPAPGDATRATLPHPEIFAALRPGHRLLLDDGRLRMTVLDCTGDRARLVVDVGGWLSDRKGVNVPDSLLAMPALTDKDRADLDFGLGLGVDWVALSFVQSADDVRQLRALVRDRAAIVAKVEKPQAIDNLQAIVEAADALMVARGDLGVEMRAEEVPILQRRIVRACRAAGKPVVVATQMLESMVAHPAPTRAEASDVASAVYEGVDAVMLSAESASGAHPQEAVVIMDGIVRQVEADPAHQDGLGLARPARPESAAGAIGAAVLSVARVLPLAATVAYTASGATALRIAHERPATGILGLTPHAATARRLCLVWGVRPVHTRDADSVEDMVDTAVRTAAALGCAPPGATLAVVAGMPFGTPGSTNLLRLVQVPVAAVAA